MESSARVSDSSRFPAAGNVPEFLVDCLGVCCRADKHIGRQFASRLTALVRSQVPEIKGKIAAVVTIDVKAVYNLPAVLLDDINCFYQNIRIISTVGRSVFGRVVQETARRSWSGRTPAGTPFTSVISPSGRQPKSCAPSI